MRKEYLLPAVASFLILALVFSSVAPVAAVVAMRARAEPVLVVKTIAEDDEFRKTGIIVLGLPIVDGTQTMPEGWPTAKGFQLGTDKLSQHKILVTFNGVPVTPTYILCELIEKDKVHPLKAPQFPQENVLTKVVDRSEDWVCKPRWGKPGVGVLDIYYVGPQTKEFVADYVLVVTAVFTVGRTQVWGSDIQDICVLGWSMGSHINTISKPTGDVHWTWDDPLGLFVSCEEATLWQRAFLFYGGGIQGV